MIIHSMDRLARNLDDLRKIVKDLTGRGVRIQFIKENLIFTGEDSPMSNLLLSLLGAGRGVREGKNSAYHLSCLKLRPSHHPEKHAQHDLY